jgi:glycopeptide antibiotics resistance protein
VQITLLAIIRVRLQLTESVTLSKCGSIPHRCSPATTSDSADMFIPRILYPFLPYRSLAFPFLVLSAIVVPVWLIFRLYRSRTPGHPPSFAREIVLLTFVVYLAGLAVATLMPNRSSRLLAAGTGGIELRPNLASLTCSSVNLPEGSTAQAFCVHNAKGNVMLFFPLGILIPLVWKRVRFWRAIQIAIALSISIELVQYLSSSWGSYRAVDVNDVLLNSFGAFLGMLLVSLLRFRPSGRPAVA